MTYPVNNVNAKENEQVNAKKSASSALYGVYRSNKQEYTVHTKKANTDWNGESLAMMQNSPVMHNLNTKTNTSKYQKWSSSVSNKKQVPAKQPIAENKVSQWCVRLLLQTPMG